MPSSSRDSVHSSGMQTISNKIGSSLQSITHHWQPTIEINIENEQGTQAKWVTSYSTMDTIKGNVSITTNHDTRFDEVEISFIGTSQVYVDRLTTTPSMSGRTEATHRFLTLKQPLGPADYPTPRVLTAGRTFTFPFIFAVPQQLLPRACGHSVSLDHVRDTHLMLPPSLGDPSLAGFGTTLLDDFAPEMSKIIYGVKVRLTSVHESDGKISLIADKMKKVRVKPAFEEQPPLNVDPSDAEYRLRQEKVIKKGLFKGKLGTLTAQSAQPKALKIPGARTFDNCPITSMAKIVLRFDPADENNLPPRLGSLATKLKVSTFYASAPRHSFPNRSNLGFDLTQGFYSENIQISSMCIASAQWEKHDYSSNPPPDSLVRRDSGISDCSMLSHDDAVSTGILAASKNYKGGHFYSAQILVPITLPNNKNFIPTFHSCLISRQYALSLRLSAHAPGVSDPSLHLKLPIQVCADGSDAGNANARARSAELDMSIEADHMFVPRSVAPPSLDDLPPQYASFAPPIQRVPVVG
ncbi:arrestin [Lophiotrema nucula]|uniref:Arrestin n=1 Tax=Lophiotrema nucula TaxID=690887 RepID=A0A6A5YYD6_9PLEO|nr:arrestin [Lophiotrema nucula]